MNSTDLSIPSPDEIENCISTLDKLIKNSTHLAHLSEDQRIALLTAAGKISRPDRKEKKKINKEQNKIQKQQIVAHERSIRAATGIRKARETAVFIAPKQITCTEKNTENSNELNSPRTCYVCKKEFTRLHFFYDSMCPECADFNYQKRFQTAPLNNRVVLITGARLKIGYQATLMLLRAGACVVATTRFPVDAALRFSKENDFHLWKDRLQIFGLDLRHTPSVELFCNFIEQKYDRLDILISNAAQTVRRPPGFYAHLMSNENLALSNLPPDAQLLLDQYQNCTSQLLSFSNKDLSSEKALPVAWNGNVPGIGIRSSAQLSQIPYSYDNSLPADTVFPVGKLDSDLQQVDLRKTNSWRLRLGEDEIKTTEMLEIQLVNAVAPFVLCNKLLPLMKRDYTGQKHIVNVSAMEGKFFRWKKDDRHPHTNMAKAALNMMTHTSAETLAKFGIFMNAVDTGWVTDEDPAYLAKLKQDLHDFQPPLDIVDGAARVCDPFFYGINSGHHWYGKFLKDYFPIDW